MKGIHMSKKVIGIRMTDEETSLISSIMRPNETMSDCMRRVVMSGLGVLTISKPGDYTELYAKFQEEFEAAQDEFHSAKLKRDGLKGKYASLGCNASELHKMGETIRLR
jgi:hypothetical protein